jgi:replicative DNA helicase
LPGPIKAAKLGARMPEKRQPRSEGEQLSEIIAELEREHEIREISGWRTGFKALSRLIDGMLPGFYVLVGRPGCGKTSFAKQLLDQVSRDNGVPGIYFSLGETKKELRIKTLARLSEIDGNEIRRGSSYLLHWYGVPKAHGAGPEELSPGWDKLRAAAEEAKPWLDRVYLVECRRGPEPAVIEDEIRAVRALTHMQPLIAVIDDCQRLSASNEALHDRVQIISERLAQTAGELSIPVLAVWPDLAAREESPHVWCERFFGADAIIVLKHDAEPSTAPSDPRQAVTLHVVKNRRGEKGELKFNFLPAFSKFVEL